MENPKVTESDSGVLEEKINNITAAIDKIDKKVDNVSESIMTIAGINKELEFNRLEFSRNRSDILSIKEKSDRSEIEIKGISTTLKISFTVIGFIATSALTVSMFMAGQLYSDNGTRAKFVGDVDKRLTILEYQSNPKGPRPFVVDGDNK